MTGAHRHLGEELEEEGWRVPPPRARSSSSGTICLRKSVRRMDQNKGVENSLELFCCCIGLLECILYASLPTFIQVQIHPHRPAKPPIISVKPIQQQHLWRRTAPHHGRTLISIGKQLQLQFMQTAGCGPPGRCQNNA